MSFLKSLMLLAVLTALSVGQAMPAMGSPPVSQEALQHAVEQTVQAAVRQRTDAGKVTDTTAANAVQEHISVSDWTGQRIEVLTTSGDIVWSFNTNDITYLCVDPSKECFPMGFAITKGVEGDVAIIAMSSYMPQNRGIREPRGAQTTMVSVRMSDKVVTSSFSLLDFRGFPSYPCPQPRWATHGSPQWYHCQLEWIHNFEVLENGNLLMPGLIGMSVLEVRPPTEIDGIGTVVNGLFFRDFIENYPEPNAVRIDQNGDWIVTFYNDGVRIGDDGLGDGEGQHDAGSVMSFTPDGEGGAEINWRFPETDGHMMGVHAAYQMASGRYIAPHGAGQINWDDPAPRNDPDHLGGTIAYFDVIDGVPDYIGEVSYANTPDLYYVRDVQPLSDGRVVIVGSGGEHPTEEMLENPDQFTKLILEQEFLVMPQGNSEKSGALGDQDITWLSHPSTTISCWPRGGLFQAVVYTPQKSFGTVLRKCDVY